MKIKAMLSSPYSAGASNRDRTAVHTSRQACRDNCAIMLHCKPKMVLSLSDAMKITLNYAMRAMRRVRPSSASTSLTRASFQR